MEHNSEEESTCYETIALRLPSNRVTCADWIRRQVPEVVADALSLAEAAVNALGRDIAEGDIAKLQQEAAEERRKLQSDPHTLQQIAEAALKTAHDEHTEDKANMSKKHDTPRRQHE